ncbi:MAG TPA: AMP-binding protein, partial [Acidimicrobiales bacterium]
MTEEPQTMAALLRTRADDDAPGILFEDRAWTWRQVVDESERRAGLAAALRRPGPFHIGVLLDNVPDYLFWLGGAALAGATVVGINPTRRGEELARDIRFADCQLVVTDTAGAALLEGLDLGLDPDRVLHIDDDPPIDAEPADFLTEEAAAGSEASERAPSDLYLL